MKFFPTQKIKVTGLLNHTIFLVELMLILYMLKLAVQTKPGCPNRCGNVNIPYPFGLSENCYLNDEFLISCNETSNKPFLRRSNTSILSIYIDGQMQVTSPIAYECFKKQDQIVNSTSRLLNFLPFTVSGSKNRLTAVGCDTIAIVGDTDDYSNSVSVSLCGEFLDVENGSCNGTGCSQSLIPKGMTSIGLKVSSTSNHTNVSEFSPCGYGFIVEESKYSFSSLDLWDLRNVKEFPMILEWSVGNITCTEAKENRETYACKGNSECFDSPIGHGYLCNCSQGYKGNPYLTDGCKDINECEDPVLNQCLEKKLCQNTIGNYTCSCPDNQHGDGRNDGQGCLVVADNQALIQIMSGVGIGLLILLLAVSWLYLGLRKRRVLKLRDKYFKENGGYLLQQRLSEHDQNSAQIFTEKDLKKATNNFHESRILGRGGQGTVYKGILPDNHIVAVKKSKIGDETQIEGFINEVTILSQINHRNVVKLLGCCLETRVPLLVYEFVTNGSLFDYIHHGMTLIPWETRLKIATEVAEALSYMHSAASTPIIHRDMKSANILLDENYTAKVSDFGASKLIPLDKSALTTLVQGTLGYLDPEYMETSQLTEKSDVYSFGVVLVELLTRKKALSFVRREEERNLAMHFVIALEQNRLHEILDNQLVNEENMDQLERVAILARSCLSVKGGERPTMKDVAIEIYEVCFQ